MKIFGSASVVIGKHRRGDSYRDASVRSVIFQRHPILSAKRRIFLLHLNVSLADPMIYGSQLIARIFPERLFHSFANQFDDKFP